MYFDGNVFPAPMFDFGLYVCADVRNKLVAVRNPKRRLTDASCVWSHRSQNVATMNKHTPPHAVGSPEEGPGRTDQAPRGKPNMCSLWCFKFGTHGTARTARRGGLRPTSALRDESQEPTTKGAGHSGHLSPNQTAPVKLGVLEVKRHGRNERVRYRPLKC